MADILLGIESSCDDTSMSVIKDGMILSNVTFSQSIHAKYGGVVPEWASRMHMEAIIPLTKETLEKSGCQLQDIKGIAVTKGPGLIGSLIVGISYAKGLALSLNIPLIEVNHLEAHVLSLLIEEPKPTFPFLCLTVSGGHTQLVYVSGYNQMELIGQSLDDAAGEAFDKTGKLLGLSYPSGPVIDRLAKSGNPVFTFPISKMKDFNYSFSGLKTSVLYFLQKQLKEDPSFIEKNLNDLCASIQHTIIEILAFKLIAAANHYKTKNIGVAGGVSANSGLRNKLKELALKYHWNTFVPSLQYCTDNAAMIALAGYYKYLDKKFAPDDFGPLARFPISEVPQS